ncbi:hypothetical protein QQF64_030008 [Cirrhinus molitorella]|uniref:Uncharacterized protein n=1 Tax=Cirrhinus molitorella TaxID=172907 RepID=A0ABR3N228_9TELE
MVNRWRYTALGRIHQSKRRRKGIKSAVIRVWFAHVVKQRKDNFEEFEEHDVEEQEPDAFGCFVLKRRFCFIPFFQYYSC